MKRLNIPIISAVDSYATCTNGIKDIGLKGKFDSSLPDFEQWAAHYVNKANNASLFSIAPLIYNKNLDPLVIGNVVKSELIKLYDYYMVKKQPARQIYDDIMLSANDKCPYCGGIGRPRTLDHYLPKSKYPQFSVLPANLLPCCRDCNTENKSTSTATTAQEQVIHPYFDNDRFFNEQWIMARVYPGNPCSLEFYVDPPAYWNKTDNDRARRHFKDFELAVRFSVQAGEELSTLIDQRREFMKTLDSNTFSQHLMSIGNTTQLFVNHWKKVMYQTLANDVWFCGEVF